MDVSLWSSGPLDLWTSRSPKLHEALFRSKLDIQSLAIVSLTLTGLTGWGSQRSLNLEKR